MKKRVILALATSIALLAPQIAQAKNEPVKVTKAEAFKGAQTVVVGSFTVGFLVEKTDIARAGGGLFGGVGGGKSKARSFLEGVGAADLQAITDESFADFKAQLAARGFTVTPSGDFASSSVSAKVKPVESPFHSSIAFDGDSKAKASYFAPTEIGRLVFYPGDVTAGGLGAIGMSMASGQAQTAASAFAKAAGTGVVNVMYLVDFADAEKYGGWFRSSSAVKVKAGLAIAPTTSRLTYHAPSSKIGTVVINQPVAVGGDFAEVRDSTGKTAKTMETIGNVVGFFGGVGTNTSRKYSFVAQPALYRAAAVEAARQANTRLIDQLTALR